MERKRLSAERFTRIWSLIETIEREPGLNRGELAERFSLSVRQLQSDLNAILNEIGLPLSRVHGYRFGGASASDALGLQDMLTFRLLVERAAGDEAFPQDALAETVRKLPSAFPSPLRDLVAKTVSATAHDGFGPGPEMFAFLTEALMAQRPVRLQYARRSGVGYIADPIVDPQILIPYHDAWYLIGYCHQRGRPLMFALDGLQSADYEPA